ncbi:MAG: protein kinase [Gammaproteobacteria bacterium]|nr:protein kinase [Gammaproteobacteria bacterium]
MPLSRPSSSELKQALEEFRDRVHSEASRKQTYEKRVAANLTGILRRELESGATAEANERKRLAHLLGRDASLGELNRELCERIRKREILSADAAVLAHLRATVLDKLRIDNPKYSEYLRARKSFQVN